jgi:hypothetical protein
MTAEELGVLLKTIQKTTQKAKESGAINSAEGLFTQISADANQFSASILDFFGAISEDQKAAIIAANQGPVDLQRQQLEFMADAANRVAMALVEARMKINAAGSATDINVNVNAPEGTKVETKQKGGNAPKVNQSKAGKT